VPRFPVDPPQHVRVPPPTALARWLTGELVGDAKHALVVRVRPGYVKRDYVSTHRLDTGEELLMQTIVASEHQYPPWVGTWTPVGPWRTLPHIQNSKWGRSFDQNGSSTLTVLMDNLVFQNEEGIAGIFHDIKRGYFSPSRGVVLASRPSLWDDTGWTNALNGGYQIEIWEGYGQGDEVTPLPEPDPVTNSCAPPGGAISRTWTGVIEQVDLTSHPDHITLTARDFGVLFTDQRLQGDNKASEIVAPTTFADQSHSMGIRPTGPRPTMESPFYLQWIDDFTENHLGQYLQATGEITFTGDPGGGIVVGPHAATLKPNVWMQGGLIILLNNDLPTDHGYIINLPGAFRYDTTAGGGPFGQVLDGDGNPVGLVDGMRDYLYYNHDTGLLSMGVGETDAKTGALVWRDFVQCTPLDHAVQPVFTLRPGAYRLLQAMSDTPVRLPNDTFGSAEAPHAVTPDSIALSSAYEGASAKTYDDTELWVAGLQTDPADHQHIDVTFGRAWPVPAQWAEGASAALNQQAIEEGLNENIDVAVGPAPLRDVGTLSAPLHPQLALLAGGNADGVTFLLGQTVKRLPVDGLTSALAIGDTVRVVNAGDFTSGFQDLPADSQVFTVNAPAVVGAKWIHVTPVAATDSWGPGDPILPGGILTELPMAAPPAVATGRAVLVTDPTGEWKQVFIARKKNNTGAGIGINRTVPIYAFPAGSTVSLVAYAPAHTGIGQFRLFTMTPLFSGCEMWVSLHLNGPGMTMDGKPMPEGWVDLNRGRTPDGVPAMLHSVLGFDTTGPLTFDLGHVFDTGNVWKLRDDGSTDGMYLTTDAVPGVTLRLTFSSLQTGHPKMPPSTRYMSTADYNALKAALTPGHYTVALQDIGLFGFYPWDPGEADPVATITTDLPVAPHIVSRLPTTALNKEVPSGAQIGVSAPLGEQVFGDQLAPVMSWQFVVRNTAPVGATHIDVVPVMLPADEGHWKYNNATQRQEWVQTQAGVHVGSGGPVTLLETFLTSPPASLTSGCGSLAEIDSYPDDAGVAGAVNAVHWVMVNDASEVVEVLLKWAGFKEWNLQWFGWSLVNPMQYGSDKFFIDIINDILSQGNFVFFMDGPTDNDASIGVPCFVQQSATAAPSDTIEVTDQDLLETVEVKWDLSSLPYVLRYRGNPVPEGEQGQTYEEDLVATFAATYYPPWAGDDYVPLNGKPPPNPPLRRTAGVVRHFTQTVGVNVPIGMNSNEQCLFACLLAAMQYAIAMATGQVQVPGLDAFTLNQQISVVDEADGINSRMWLASVESDHSTGTNGKWVMILGGSYLDTEDMELLLDDYTYATTQVKPQQPTGEQYVGVPSSAEGEYQLSTGLEAFKPAAPLGAG
jgi:hypothetical protein